MKELINNRLERIWDVVTKELEQAEAPSDIKKMFVAYGFLENIILNISQDLEDPELQIRLLNYCEFAMKAVSDFGVNKEQPVDIPVKSAEILQFPPKT